MITFKEYLVENRIEFLLKKYHDINADHEIPFRPYIERTPEGIIGYLAALDPTPNKKYLDWLLNQYKKRNFRQEDFIRVSSLLQDFEHFKSKIPQKDINQYKDLVYLRNAIQKAEGIVDQERAGYPTDHEGAIKILDKAGVIVYKILTFAAAKFYAEKTEWCTKMRKNFDEYDQHGKYPLYVVLVNANNARRWQKYQFHFGSEQFMDVDDREIDAGGLTIDHPALKEIPEWQGEESWCTSDKTFNNEKEFIKAFVKNPFMIIHTLRTGVKQLHWILDNAPLESYLEPNIEDYVVDNSNIDETVMLKILEHPGKYGINMVHSVVKHPRATKKVLDYVVKHDLGYGKIAQGRLDSMEYQK